MAGSFVMFKMPAPTRRGDTYVGTVVIQGRVHYVECRPVGATPAIRAHFKGAVFPAFTGELQFDSHKDRLEKAALKYASGEFLDDPWPGEPR